MTDRHSGYIVTLSKDLREDDAEDTINALKMVRGVASVEPVTADIPVAIAQSRADMEWREKLTSLILEK